jgi:hypothetical protein
MSEAYDPAQTILAVLDMPPDVAAAAVQKRLGPLEFLDRRLEGCFWDFVGVAVSPTPAVPDYPSLRIGPRGQPPIEQVQIWLWRVSHPPGRVYGEWRWHPERGESMGIAGLTPDDNFRAIQRAWQWLQITHRVSRRGHPVGGGYFASDAALLEQIRIIVRQGHVHGLRPTQSRVAQSLSISVEPRYLRRLCARLGVSWEAHSIGFSGRQ